MSLQTWTEVLWSSIADGTAIASSTTETILVPDYTFNANYMYPGRTLQIMLRGKFGTVVTTPGNLTFQIRWGGVAGTSLCSSIAIPLNVAAQTNDSFKLEATIVCRSTGTSGSLHGMGHADLGAGAATNGINFMPATGAAATTVDTTTSKALSVTAQFSISNAANTITALHYVLEAVN